MMKAPSNPQEYERARAARLREDAERARSDDDLRRQVEKIEAEVQGLWDILGHTEDSNDKRTSVRKPL
jgi:hypothetical protein